MIAWERERMPRAPPCRAAAERGYLRSDTPRCEASHNAATTHLGRRQATRMISVDNLVQGGQATVTVTSSSRIGQTVTVTITSGTGDQDSVDVVIGEDGKGTSSWQVPEDWEEATFADGVCDEINRIIAQGTGG